MNLPKIKPIIGTISTGKENTPIPCKVNLYSGEITLNSYNYLWTSEPLNLQFYFEDIAYVMPVIGIGGKYFVHDYKNQEFFKIFSLSSKLEKELSKTTEILPKKNKI